VCTTFRLKTRDDDVIVGRSMEFAADMGWKLVIAPRGAAFTGTAPDGPGRAWTATHGFVGVTAMGRPVGVTDGINEAGLSAALLYLPGYAKYQDADGVPAADCVSPDEVAALVLATAATVAEAIAAIESVTVWNRVEEVLGSTLPVHLVLFDRGGAGAVIEWVEGERHVHDNPVGVCTNAPPFDWHLTNLGNYVNLRAGNAEPLELAGLEVEQIGQGSGLLGLPGDWTPPSRFIRATALAQSASELTDADEALHTALHIINNFDIPRGLVRAGASAEYTGWVSVGDLAGGRYVIRTYEDPTPRMVTLADLDLAGGGEARQVPLPSSPTIAAFAL
jgi:choloylglycine hydrolase